MPDAPLAFETESLPVARDHFVLGRLRLRVVDGPDKGRVFTSGGSRTTIGSDPSADFVLTDTAVSRFHCEVQIDQRTTTVRDVGSTNGTVVNGVTVREARLDPNAVLVLGRSCLRVEVVADGVKVRLSERETFGRMVGRSPAIRRVFMLLEQAAASDVTVLLLGETGTGKEVAAESVHVESDRRDGPFVAVDCGAMPPNLIESELFGHERGAFTGADRPRQGALEAANGGTLFLDEIGELGADLQPKLLRALERREIRRLGSNKVLPLDVRLVAATNRDLRAEVNAGRFRADLYFRLAVLEVRLPPLRERGEDVPLLVEHLVQRLMPDNPATAITRTAAFQNAVLHHRWPGNVRELRNYIERCVTLQEAENEPSMSEGPRATGQVVADIGEAFSMGRERVIGAYERSYLEQLLAARGGNVSAAARAAQMDRVHCHRLLRKYGIRRED